MNEVLKDEKKILKGLEKLGYFANMKTAIAIRNAYLLKKPLFIEGPPGVGKTQLAKAVNQLIKSKWFRLQCTPEMTERKAVYEMNYQKQLLNIQLYKNADDSNKIDDASFFTRDYVIERPILQALQQEETSVLLVDELDKSSEEFEYALLEIFGEYSVSIPEIKETVFAKEVPLIIITSNNSRPISETILRRCVYLYIDYPTFEEEVHIMETIAQVNKAVAKGVATVMQKLRNDSNAKLKQIPSISESIEWAKVISIHLENEEALENEELKEQMLQNLNVISKTKNDQEKIEKKIELVMS